MGLDTLLLDFLWTHPNSLDWLIKSSGPNCVCVIYDIYIYIYELLLLLLLLLLYKGKRQAIVLFCLVFSLGAEKSTHCTNELFRAHIQIVLGVEREEPIEPRFSLHHELIVVLDISVA